MTRKAGQIIAVVALASLAATRLSAADFTFNVPVNISNLHPGVDEVRIQCAVTKGYDFGTGPLRPHPDLIAWGHKSLGKPVSGYSGTVAVTIDSLPGKDPAEGKMYKCKLLLMKSGASYEPTYDAKELFYKPNSNAVLKTSQLGVVQ